MTCVIFSRQKAKERGKICLHPDSKHYILFGFVYSDIPLTLKGRYPRRTYKPSMPFLQRLLRKKRVHWGVIFVCFFSVIRTCFWEIGKTPSSAHIILYFILPFIFISFLDLKTSVTPAVWSIPQNCQEMTSAGGDSLPPGLLHAARLHQVMRKGFPWTGGLTSKRGFPWTGGLTNKRGFPWTGGLANKRGFPWTGGLTHKRGKKIRNLAEFNVNDQQNEESE